MLLAYEQNLFSLPTGIHQVHLPPIPEEQRGVYANKALHGEPLAVSVIPSMITMTKNSNDTTNYICKSSRVFPFSLSLSHPVRFRLSLHGSTIHYGNKAQRTEQSDTGPSRDDARQPHARRPIKSRQPHFYEPFRWCFISTTHITQTVHANPSTCQTTTITRSRKVF